MLKNSFLNDFKLFLRILPFGAIVFAVYALIQWFKFSYILTNQKRFLLDTLMVFADSILINAVCILIVPPLLLSKYPKQGLFSVFFSSLVSLPKVVLSYFFLMVLTQFSFEISQSSPIPALIILVLFIWAPYFVSMEQFALQESQDKEIDEDELNNFDPFDESLYTEKPKTFFSNKQPWRIGFSRSLEFTSKNSSLALSIVFVIWLVKVIPELIVSLTLDTNTSYQAHIIQSAITAIGAIIVNIAVFRTLFKGLEPAHREELLHTFGQEYKEFINPAVISVPNGARITVLCLLVIFTTAIWSEKKIQVGSFPKEAKLIVSDYKAKEGEIVLKLEIQDEISKFRWFMPERFRFYEINPEKTKKEKEAENGEQKKDQKQEDQKPTDLNVSENKLEPENDSLKKLVAILKEKLVNPLRLVVYDQEGKVLEPYQYSPRGGVLKVVLAFPVEAVKQKKEVGGKVIKNLYEISYLNQFGIKQVLLTFSEDSGESLIGKEIPHD